MIGFDLRDVGLKVLGRKTSLNFHGFSFVWILSVKFIQN